MFLLTQSPVYFLPVLTAFLGGYLSGSVPYGLILTRLFGLGDIRQIGSGNIGATNVLRTGSKKVAAATLLLDALKAYVPVIIAAQFHADYAVMAALGAFLGHLFPVWLKFKGGKGVASAIGIAFAFSPLLGLAICLTWAGVAFISRISSLSALTAFGLSPLYAGLIIGNLQMAATVFVIAVLVFVRHSDNIKRLIDGSESKIGKKA